MTRAEILDTARHIVTPEKLHELLKCEADLGFLYWKERPGRDAQTRSWNVRYVGKRALVYRDKRGVLTGNILGKVVKAHRVVWAMVNNCWPNGIIDHINGDPSDNRISNLRLVDCEQNAKNAKKRLDNSSGRVGVYQRKNGVWSARIQSGGREMHLGSFERFEDACQCRAAAEIAYNFHENHGRAK